MTSLALIGPIGLPEMVIIGVVGLLVFGRRLPEVGRSLAHSIVEFKRGLQGVNVEGQGVPRLPTEAPVAPIVEPARELGRVTSEPDR